MRNPSLFDSPFRDQPVGTKDDGFRKNSTHPCIGATILRRRMIGSDAPRGRKTANQVGASKSASPAHEHCSWHCSWALARFGKAAYTLVRGDVISSQCIFEGETDGVDFERGTDGFETN
jgi:hypothetical protein